MIRVLVVEDDPAVAQLLALTLQREAYEVHVVSTGASALYSVEHGVQCAVVDLGLPDMEGLALCRELRRLRPALPIVVVSARSSEADMVLALDAGADDYLVKPFRRNELLARLRAVLRRSQGSDLVFVDDLAVDVNRFEARVSGVALQLTPKEFELLCLLARRPGQVVLRSELVATLWPNSLPDHSKSLDMHLSTLRRKLQDADAHVTVTTVRGKGFMLG